MLTAVALVEQPAVGGAVPLPTPPPGDDEVEAAWDRADTVAGRIGRLANQVAQTDAALLALQSELAVKREQTNQALESLRATQAAAGAAQAAADQARTQAEVASARIRTAQRQLDQFAAGSYRQGSLIGSLSAFLDSDSPQDLLARVELLDAVGGAQLDALENLRRARTQSANKDAQARRALSVAQSARTAAATAKTAADLAYQAAIAAERAQRERAGALRTRQTDLEQQFAAQWVIAGLAGQRRGQVQWGTGRGGGQVVSAAQTPASKGVATVISRAMAQRGVRYSWGGGDAGGPTVGIRDGGIGDSHGDYRAVGFDCSGLMIYAFAPVLGYSLPHYSEAQYDSGSKVPLVLKRPGDMLFWGSRGQVHHVALYLGAEQMIEAPYSGAVVRVTSVRYSGIMPYAVRLL
ncbi:MAG TPA: NlpC/P60 family protein [Pseudonocardiaceae bacterium]|nr:NlpC/P60 family protein [Pseudonocardiaceae bacterium]